MWILSIVALVFLLSLVEGSPMKDHSRNHEKVMDGKKFNIFLSRLDPKFFHNECLISTEEKPSVYGENLKLSDYEIIANETLMLAKLEVVSKGLSQEYF